MPALAAGIHVFLDRVSQDVDRRHKAGDDVENVIEGRHPGAAQQSPGSRTTTLPQQV